jgi:VanZ family protein
MVNRSWLVRSIGVLSCLTFVAGMFVGGAQPEAVGLVPAPWDKLAHLVSFGLLTALVELALRPPAWLLVALPLAVSAADEVHQAFLPGRFASLEDWLAGALGVGIACLLLRHTRLAQMVTDLRG